MIDDITPASTATSISLLRDSYPGSVLILEGYSDIKLYSKFINEESCQIINGFNKSNVIKIMEILDQRGFKGALAIVDADYWNITGTTSPSQNLLITDYHDLETMLFSSPSLDELIREYGSQDKIRVFQSKYKSSLREEILNASIPIGCLRYISANQQLNLRFEGLSFKKFTSDRKRISINQKRLVKTVCDNSQRHDIDKKTLLSNLCNEIEKNSDALQVCCGHDLISFLSISLKCLFGSNNSNEVCVGILEIGLRLGFQLAYFKTTILFERITNWESTSGYEVLLIEQ